jgi:predicted amidohydrolase YtcJ
MNGRRYTVLAASLLALAIAACGGGQEASETLELAATPAVAPADLVLRGGKVATVDPALGNAEAIAVNGYQITAVGGNDEISAYIGPDTEVIELNGRFAMPGFIEGHGHYMSLGRARQILDLTKVNNWGEIVTMVAGAVDKSQPGEWIFGRGWHQDKWDSVPDDAVDGVPRNDTLNAVSPDNPVSLGHASGHAGFFNDAALAVGGIDDDTPDPPGGTIVRTPDGRATGLMRETSQRLLNEAIGIYEGRLTPEEMKHIDRERAMLAADEALAHGVTSFHDAGSSFETIDFFKELEEEGKLPVRLYVMVRRESNELMDQALPQYKMLPEGNDYLTVRSIKRQIDGALGSHGAWLPSLPSNTASRSIRMRSVIALSARRWIFTNACGSGWRLTASPCAGASSIRSILIHSTYRVSVVLASSRPYRRSTEHQMVPGFHPDSATSARKAHLSRGALYSIPARS